MHAISIDGFPLYYNKTITGLNAGLVGLSLTYTISLAGIVQFCVRQSAEVENNVSQMSHYIIILILHLSVSE